MGFLNFDFLVSKGEITKLLHLTRSGKSLSKTVFGKKFKLSNRSFQGMKNWKCTTT